MRPVLRFMGMVALGGLLLAIVGCGSSVDPKSEAAKAKRAAEQKPGKSKAEDMNE